MDPQLQTPPPQPPQSPPSVSSENSSRSFWKTLAIGMSIVSFGIALAVGGYFLGANKNKTAEAPTSQITSTPTPTPSSVNVGAGCKIGGCSGQICQNETDEGAITTCEYKEEYACYKTAKCEKQANGKCGWTQTADLSSCLSSS